MTKQFDARKTPRYEKDVTLFIEVLAASNFGDQDDDIVICNTLDLSATGAQVIIDQAVPQGNIIRICLQVADHMPVFVVAKVVWQKKAEQLEAYHLGLNLMPSLGTDYQQWRSRVEQLFIEVS